MLPETVLIQSVLNRKLSVALVILNSHNIQHVVEYVDGVPSILLNDFVSSRVRLTVDQNGNVISARVG